MAEYDAIIFNIPPLYAERSPHIREAVVPSLLPLSLIRSVAIKTGYLFIGESEPEPGAAIPRELPLEYDWVKN